MKKKNFFKEVLSRHTGYLFPACFSVFSKLSTNEQVFYAVKQQLWTNCVSFHFLMQEDGAFLTYEQWGNVCEVAITWSPLHKCQLKNDSAH